MVTRQRQQQLLQTNVDISDYPSVPPVLTGDSTVDNIVDMIPAAKGGAAMVCLGQGESMVAVVDGRRPQKNPSTDLPG